MRKPRLDQEGIYYVTVKGNPRELLFNTPADYEYFLDIIRSRKQKYNFKIYAFCLMPRYYHLLIETTPAANISKIMQALNTSYALYFNKKYQHTGHIVAGRFESRLINKDHSLVEIIRRIHLNPLQLKLVKELKDYKWSSFPEYLGINTGLTATGDVKSFGYAPETDKDYAVSAQRHLSSFKKYYLVPVSLLILFFILLQGPPRKEYSRNADNILVKGKSFIALPNGLPQPQIAKNYGPKQAWEIWNVQ